MTFIHSFCRCSKEWILINNGILIKNFERSFMNFVKCMFSVNCLVREERLLKAAVFFFVYIKLIPVGGAVF